MAEQQFDTIIVGGGLAGLVIARELCTAGRTVTLVEARPRLGGRAYFDAFGPGGVLVEYGAGWVDPNYQPLIAAEIDRYELELTHGEPGVQQRTVSGEQILHGMLPVPYEDITEFERAVFECLAASRRIEYGRPWEEQGLEDLDVSWADFVRGLNLAPAVNEYLMTWTSASDPEESSALNILALFATFGYSAWAAYNSMELKFKDGTSALVDAIASDVRAEVFLDCPATRIEHDHEGVRVHTEDGRVFNGSSAVLAVPLNTWDTIDFDPPLSDGKQAAAKAKHVGTGQKVWMEIDGAPTGGVFGWGFGRGINWLMRDRRLEDGGDLYVGFTGGGRLDIDDKAMVQDAVRVFAPEAEVGRVAEHDWLEDPYSRGVWAVYRPGHFTSYHSELSRPEGRLHFAGADLSFGQQLWMEGAFESGLAVADRLLGRV